MKNLFLVRHAQAVENTGRATDLYRNLTPLGFRNATKIGRKIFEMDIQPDMIFSSHSERTRSTAELIAEQIKFDAQKIEFTEELYEASARTLFAFIKNFNDEWNHVLIIGHNPSITYFAEYITHQSIGVVSPAGLVYIQFEVDQWNLIDEGNGKFIKYEHIENED
jgi:phosphohistidine phosphatase